MAHVKRVRFAIEEERCEDCWGTARKLRQHQRALDSALRLQRMEAAQLQQLQQQLSACQDEKAVLRGTVVRLERELQSARYDVEELEGARLRKRQRDSAAAAADGARVTELERQLADCQTQLRACLAENAKLKDEARRRSSGGSHAGEGVQQQQQQQPQQQPQQGQEQQGQQGQEQQPGGPPAGGAAEMDAGSGGAAAAVAPAAVQQAPGGSGAGGAAPSFSSRGRDAAETLVEVRHGGPMPAQPAQERRKPSSDTQPS